MEKNRLIKEIIIDNYSEYIKKANKVRPIPYIKGSKKLPQKYSDDNVFEWRKIRYWGRPIEARFLKGASDKEFLISNSKTANKPRLVKLNGNDIYNQSVNSFQRSFIANVVTEYYEDHIKDLEVIKDIDNYPLNIWIKFFIHDMGKRNIDNDNKWVWNKFFQDTLVKNKIIHDDSIQYINDTRLTTIVIPEELEQKMVIGIYKADKEEDYGLKEYYFGDK